MKLRVLVGAAILSACHSNPKTSAVPPVEQPQPLATTYRVISGISMGGIGSSTIGMHHPELFDAVAPMGGPLDERFLMHMIETQLMAGFCSYDQIQAQLKLDPTGVSLNDPQVMSCVRDVPGTTLSQHTESFNHWRFTDSGGHFNRDSYGNLFYDLTVAFGNLTSYNPDSPFSPTGVPVAIAKAPPADTCTNPFRIKGFNSDPNAHPVYSKEYNPQGLYDAITFCDGQPSPIYYCMNPTRPVDFCALHGSANPVAPADEAAYVTQYCGGPQFTAWDVSSDAANTRQDILDVYNQGMGRIDACRQRVTPFALALAVDYNGNGVRDYAEPVIFNSHERYQDVGTDGCADALEDGKGGCVANAADSPYASGVADPNHDDYDPLTNPLGTEGDWRYELGEPFEDYGLDGVPNTGDYGEGDGVYSESPALQRMESYDPRTNYLKLTPAQRRLIDVYLDGGIRDVFNFGVAATILHSAIWAMAPSEAMLYYGFSSIPSVLPNVTESSAAGDKMLWAETPRNVAEVYGTLDPTTQELNEGDGDHVGTDAQAVDRFTTLESWVANRWPTLPEVPQEMPSDDYDQRQLNTTFFSQALGATTAYSIYLPPGYFEADLADQRYPVLYLMHGYGQDPQSLAATSIAIFEPVMTAPEPNTPPLNDRKYIVVFPDGRCCFQTAAGDRDCTETHADDPTWTRECQEGSFYVNAAGFSNDGGLPYEDGFIDLVHYVDENYRTLPAASVVQR